jgi:glycosyltransferase involved in cell wall biosynthesis
VNVQPFVSVVTPVYNGAPFLRQCIESVLAQTWTEFEYLIVDNESTDATLEIAREYAADPRVRVLTPSGFVSADANANRALRAIDPDAVYVKVVHADDWLYPECVEKMVALAEANPTVGIVSAYRRLGERVDLVGLAPDVCVLSGREVGRSALLGGPLPYLFGSPTSLLLRADLVRKRPEFYSLANPRANPVAPRDLGQSDQKACLDLLRESDLGFVHDVLTFTRRHDESESPFYLRVGAQYPCALRLLLEYGQAYLNREAYRRKLAVRVAEYVLYLLTRPWKLLGREFLVYHAGELRDLARRIRIRDVATGILVQIRGLAKSLGSSDAIG